jgi:site-specific DNA-methyltransferase (adenine-specific)
MNLLLGDCKDKLKELEDNSIDAIVTDPPYELGFMGKDWDDTGIANDPDMWGECLRVLKPGGFLLAFSGTRTYHRMASAIEDAGFEIRDMIEWVYGSGFPKSHNIGKSVDKLQGNEREVIRKEKEPLRQGGNVNWDMRSSSSSRALDKGTSEWEGWGTALKPAHEPICMAMKPREGTFADNCLKYGVGGINIDESRVEGDMGKDRALSTPRRTDNTKYGKANETINPQSPLGRFPANLIHDNSEEVRECFPETKSGWTNKDVVKTKKKNQIYYGGATEGQTGTHYSDNSGSAARYFKSIIYESKASKKERNIGCEGLEEKHPSEVTGRKVGSAGAQNGGYAGMTETPRANIHPTVKPVALMEYLINMVSREGQVILDPFMGSGTTGMACKKLNREFVGIEMMEEYMEIAKARIDGVELSEEEVLERDQLTLNEV